MKKRISKILIIAISLIVLNAPLFFIAKRNYISNEQPDFPASFEDRLNIADTTFAPQKQIFTASKNGLSGISFLVFNGNLFSAQELRLKIYSAENLEKSLISKDYRISPNCLFDVVSLTFDQIPDSQNKQFVAIISRKNTPKEMSKEILVGDKYKLNARPLYHTDNILQDAYYRTSQYKPPLLKNPFLVIAYLAFNLLFLLLIIHLMTNKKITE